MTARKPRTERTPTAVQVQRFEEVCIEVGTYMKRKAAENEVKAHA